MDDSAKELLKHLTSLITVSETKVTASVEKTVEALANDFNSWKPLLESRVDNLQAAVVELQQHAVGTPSDAPTASSGGDPVAAHLADARGPLVPPLMGKRPLGADLEQGHGESTLHRGGTLGAPAAPVFTLVMGMTNFQTPMHLRSSGNDSENSVNPMLAHMGHANPSLQFPVFDGENPQIWQTIAEEYFAMFAIHESYWVSMSILNFVGPPKIWLHSVKKKLPNLDWASFCTLLCTRFGRDRHQMLIRQFYTLKQTYIVEEYIEHFENVMNNVIAYSDAIHPLYFLTCFIEGLMSDITTVVMVQRPLDLDAACALALLQEEVAESLRPAVQKHPGRPLPLPPPPANRPILQNVTNTLADRKAPDRRNAEQNAKLQTLRDYRRARGLCFKCSERWGKDHTCPATIQLHIVEELLEFMGADALGMHDEHETEIVCLISL